MSGPGEPTRPSGALAVWVDGALVDPSAARVSAFDHGLTVGDGVFETLRVHRGVPFARRRHLDRLERSAAGLGVRLPDREVLEEACRAVVGAAGAETGRVRLTVTDGAGPLGSARGAGSPTVVAALAPLGPVATTGTVAVAPWVRNERGVLAGLKTTSYAENVAALAWALERGADEALFANTRGELCEGTGTNVFLVPAGGAGLLTPPLSSGCLAGVTRELVLEVARAEEAVLPVDAVHDAEEVFVTSSVREVQPVTAVDGRPLPAAPGPRTAEARAAFDALVARDLDP